CRQRGAKRHNVLIDGPVWIVGRSGSCRALSLPETRLSFRDSIRPVRPRPFILSYSLPGRAVGRQDLKPTRVVGADVGTEVRVAVVPEVRGVKNDHPAGTG